MAVFELYLSSTQVDQNCTPTLRQICAKRKLRAAKTVRASMLSMEPLLRADDQFRIIHLVRDPRAVVASRLATKDESVISSYALRSNGNASVPAKETPAVREASLYCRRAAVDLELSRLLQTRYPGRIMTVRYEDVLADVGRHAEAVYRFLGFEQVPRETDAWIKQDQQKMDAKLAAKGAVSTLDKWKKVINAEMDSAIVNGVCKRFFSLYNDIGGGGAGSGNS